MPKFERVVKIDGAECKLLVQAQDVATYREIERPHMLHVVIGETVLYSLHVTPQEAGATRAATIGVPYAINRPAEPRSRYLPKTCSPGSTTNET